MRFAGHETSSCRIERGEAQAPLDRALGFYYQPAFFCSVRSLYLQPFVRGSTQAAGSTTHTPERSSSTYSIVYYFLYTVEVREVFVLLCPGF